jgi:hypothetical protein
MTLKNLALVRLAVREGNGLGNTCKVTGNDFADMHKALVEDKNFMAEITASFYAAKADLLVASSGASGMKDFKTALAATERLRSMNKLYMFGEADGYREGSDDLSPNKVAACLVELGLDILETAYAIGITEREMNAFLINNPHVLKHAKSVKE